MYGISRPWRFADDFKYYNSHSRYAGFYGYEHDYRLYRYGHDAYRLYKYGYYAYRHHKYRHANAYRYRHAGTYRHRHCADAYGHDACRLY